jgi:hypothetical protein
VIHISLLPQHNVTPTTPASSGTARNRCASEVSTHLTWFRFSQVTQSLSSQRLARSAIFAFDRRCCTHQAFQPEVPPSRLLHLLRRSLDAESSMLIGHDVVFVIRVYRLVLWWDIDLFGRKLETGEVFEQVGVMRLVEMEIGE